MRKILAWFLTIVGVASFFFGIYLWYMNGSDERYLPIGSILTILSLLIFSIGGKTLTEIKKESSPSSSPKKFNIFTVIITIIIAFGALLFITNFL